MNSYYGNLQSCVLSAKGQSETWDLYWCFKLKLIQIKHNGPKLLYDKAAQIFQKPTSHIKILGPRRVTFNKFHAEDPEIFGTTVKKQPPRRPGAWGWEPLLHGSKCCPIQLHTSLSERLLKYCPLLAGWYCTTRYHTAYKWYTATWKSCKTRPENQTENLLSCRNDMIWNVHENRPSSYVRFANHCNRVLASY